MTVDVDKLLSFFWGLTNFILSIFMIFGVLYLIYYKIGKAIVNGLYVFLAAAVFNILVTAIIKYGFKQLMHWKDKRIQLSNDVIEGIKSIKYLSWEKIFEDKINAFRKKEFYALFLIKGGDGFLSIFWNSI